MQTAHLSVLFVCVCVCVCVCTCMFDCMCVSRSVLAAHSLFEVIVVYINTCNMFSIPAGLAVVIVLPPLHNFPLYHPVYSSLSVLGMAVLETH